MRCFLASDELAQQLQARVRTSPLVAPRQRSPCWRTGFAGLSQPNRFADSSPWRDRNLRLALTFYSHETTSTISRPH